MWDVTVRPGSQLEWMCFWVPLSFLCLMFTGDCRQQIPNCFSNGRNLPSEALCKNKHRHDVKPWADRTPGEVYCVRFSHFSLPYWLCINAPQAPKTPRLLVVTFYPLRNKIKYGELYLEYNWKMKLLIHVSHVTANIDLFFFFPLIELLAGCKQVLLKWKRVYCESTMQ